MIDEEIMLLIAQASSAITSVIGIALLIYIIKVIKHLVKENYRKKFSWLGIFFLVVLLGVISMTLYHFLDGSGDYKYEELAGSAEFLWYLSMFISVLISVYGSYVIIQFGKSMTKIKEVVLKTKSLPQKRKPKKR